MNAGYASSIQVIKATPGYAWTTATLNGTRTGMAPTEQAAWIHAREAQNRLEHD